MKNIYQLASKFNVIVGTPGILAASILLLTLFPANTHAQGQSLSIYPPVIEVQTTPPSSPSVPIIIQNNFESDVTLKIELIPFKQKGASGQIELLPEQINKGFYKYYKDRIQFLNEGIKSSTIELLALETKEIVLNINLSKGDPPGDYYYSIVFISDGKFPSESSASSLPTGIATNLLLSIGPKGEAIGGISEFSTSTFKTNGPVEFDLKIHNGSKHLISPSGKVEISNMLGSRVGSVDILPQFILESSDRYMMDSKQGSNGAKLDFTSNPKVIWPEKFLLGLYKSTASITLFEGQKSITAVSYFLAFPLYFFIPLAALLFVSISVYVRVRKKI